jgi:flagellar hook-associated protein 2
MLAQAAGGVTSTGTGVAATQLAALDRSIAALNPRVDDMQRRLDLRRATLVQQFARMESAMGRVQAQGNWLTQQVNALNGLQGQRR